MVAAPIATQRRVLKEVFWVNPQQLQESSNGYVKKLPGGRFEVCCKGQHVGVQNRNGRVYPLPTWARHLMPGAYFYEKIKSRRCVGQVEHPQTGRSSMDKGAIVVTDAWIDEDTGELWIVFETMSTPHGKIVSAYIADNVGFGVSSRGNGSTRSNGEADVVQDDFEPVTWDTVLDESTIGAEVPAEAMSQAESTNRDKLYKWAMDEILRERDKVLTEANGNEAAASLLARTQTEQLLVECYGDVCTLKPRCSCGGACDGCKQSILTETKTGGDVDPPKGYNELLLTTPDGSGHYRAYDDGQSRYDVWLMVHNLKPEQIASGLQTMTSAKKAAENHLQMILSGRGEGPTPVPGSMPSYADPDVDVGGASDAEGDGKKGSEGGGGGKSGSEKVNINVTVGEREEGTVSKQNEGFEVKDKFHVSGSSVYLHQFDGDDEMKKAAKSLEKAGFLGVEVHDDVIAVHTGYDDPDQACAHIRRVLDHAGMQMVESQTVSKRRNLKEGVQEFNEELRQAKDADDDIDVPTHSWVGGSMVKPAKNKGVNEGSYEMSGMPMEMMALMAGFMAEMSRASMGEEGEDPAQGYPTDYPSDHNRTYPSNVDYPTHGGAPSAQGGYPGHPDHADTPWAYEGGPQFTSEIRMSRQPDRGVGWYEDSIPSQGWPGDKGHEPNVGPATGQMAGPQTHPLQTTEPGFKRAYEMGRMMAGRMRSNYGKAPVLVPNMDDLALMLGYGFEARADSPPGGVQDPDGPSNDLGMTESGYLSGYQPVLDDPEDIDLDLDVNDPELNIDKADSGPSPYDHDSTDTTHGYAESLEKAGFTYEAKMSKDAREYISKKVSKLDDEHPDWSQERKVAAAHSMARKKGYEVPKKNNKSESTNKPQEESTMRPGASPQAFGASPSYAYKVENRTNGSFVKFYFNESHKLVEMREFSKDGKLVQRAGFCAPGSGIKAESTKKPPEQIPEVVSETIKRALPAFVRGQQEVVKQVFAEQAGQATPHSAAKVPDYDDVQGVDPSYHLDPDKQRGGTADKAKQGAGGGTPGGQATTSTRDASAPAKQVSEGDKEDDEDDDEKKESSVSEGEKKDDEDDEKDESRLDPRPQKELKDALAEANKKIERLQEDNEKLTKLIDEMSRLQQAERVQHRLESILRENPELGRLKHKLEVCESIEQLDREAKEYLEAIHEAGGYRPQLPSMNENAPQNGNGKQPESSSNPPGRDTAGKTSASSKNTPGVPVGALAEGVASLPALGSNGGGSEDDSTFSRVAQYRRRRR